MIQPVRIQRSRQHKQVSQNGLEIVYCGRPTKWGNPFKIGNSLLDVPFIIIKKTELTEAEQDGGIITQGISVRLFETFLTLYGAADFIQQIKENLKGKNLSCWCKVGEPCHVDVLLKIANEL